MFILTARSFPSRSGLAQANVLSLKGLLSLVPSKLWRWDSLFLLTQLAWTESEYWTVLFWFLLENWNIKSSPCNLSAQSVSRRSFVLLTKPKVTTTSAGRKWCICLTSLVQWFLSLNSTCLLCLNKLVLCCYYPWPDNGSNIIFLLMIFESNKWRFSKMVGTTAM